MFVDEYTEFRDLAKLIVEVAGRGRVPPTMPYPLARVLATAAEGVSRITKKPPLIASGQLTFMHWQPRPDSAKAQRELGWRPTPLREGVARTLAALGLLEPEA